MSEVGGQPRREFGDEAEQTAAAFLEAAGYQIHHRNYRCRHGELDVVAEKDGVVCFVEVRMRSTAVWGDPSHTVSGKKQRRVVNAAQHYLQRFAHELRDRMIRFDVISVVGRGSDARVEHLPGAFDAGR